MQNIHISQTIKELCQNNNISITELQSQCNLSKSFIYDLEKRSASPSCQKISKIADYFNCSVDYLLGRTDNPAVNTSITQKFVVSNIGISNENLKSTQTTIIPFYCEPASAGTGTWLSEDTPVEYITIPKTKEAEKADFMLKVSGDSMQPKFFDGDLILVKQEISILEGKIGVFILNGDSYIKKMGKGELISLNPNYKPIKFNEFDDIRCVGKVIDKIVLE